MTAIHCRSLVRLDPAITDILQFPIYNQLQQLGLPGLHANIVYDAIPTDPMAVNNPMVNATIFNVACGTLPEARQISSSFRSKGFASAQWLIELGQGTSQVLQLGYPRKRITVTSKVSIC